ncbi:MAG: ribosomal RNA small subunit methyltransferase A [Armatimonadetes bacterium]|nr:ribosomal RNA small subunit methyltransferase A [Armatimonadota bacterium]
MSHPEIPSLLEKTRYLCRALNIRGGRKKGQHFLISERVLDQIVSFARLRKEDFVLEIGPGLGVLTEAIALKVGSLIGVEIDPVLVGYLRETFRSSPIAHILEGDILKLNLEEVLPQREAPWKVVANIPYHQTSPILQKLLGARGLISELFLTMQLEVAQRLVATPGSKAYGVLTLACRYFAEADLLLAIPRTAFHPVPEVNSALVGIRLRPTPLYPEKDEADFFRLVHGAFGNRRKTLRNALLGSLGLSREVLEAAFLEAEIDGNRRGETLSISEFRELQISLSKGICPGR